MIKLQVTLFFSSCNATNENNSVWFGFNANLSNRSCQNNFVFTLLKLMHYNSNSLVKDIVIKLSERAGQ